MTVPLCGHPHDPPQRPQRPTGRNVVLKKTVTVRLTLRLCGQRVHVVYGVWQMFLPTEKLYFTRDVPEANCMPQGLEPPAKPAAKPAPKAAKPPAKPSKRADKPAARVAACRRSHSCGPC